MYSTSPTVLFSFRKLGFQVPASVSEANLSTILKMCNLPKVITPFPSTLKKGRKLWKKRRSKIWKNGTKLEKNKEKISKKNKKETSKKVERNSQKVEGKSQKKRKENLRIRRKFLLFSKTNRKL